MTGTRIPFEDLHRLLSRLSSANGVAVQVAEALATTIVKAECDGCTGHGLFRIQGYLASLRSGYVDGNAVPTIDRTRSSVLVADGRRGFAQAPLADARAEPLEAVRDNGIACLAISNAHHYASLANDIESFADEGFFALAMLNGRARVAPWGAQRAVIGTNPIAFACPRAHGPPFLWDMATSAVANADVLIAARDDHELPPNVALDSRGERTTDANAVLRGGALLPFGSHKGSALAVTIELLCSTLIGGQFGLEEVKRAPSGGLTSNAGRLIILMDPAATGGMAAAERVTALLQELSGASASRLPGDRRHAVRVKADRSGILVATDVLDDLHRLAGTLPDKNPARLQLSINHKPLET